MVTLIIQNVASATTCVAREHKFTADSSAKVQEKRGIYYSN